MELRSFISETLTQIVGGVDDARKKSGAHLIAPTMFSIESDRMEGVGRDAQDGNALFLVDFDVAVTAEEKKDQQLKAGISVVGIGGAGGDTGTSKRSENVSRIRFKVPVRLDKPENA